MARLQFSAILVTIILYFLVMKVNSKKITEILVWEEDHFIKELSIEDIPEYCQKNGICSNITIYDTDFVDKLLTRVQRNFNTDQLIVPDINYIEETDELCPSKIGFIRPQAAIDEEGKWEYIINTKKRQYQVYQKHTCIESGSSCSKVATSEGFDNYCYQEKSLIKMVYMDVKNKKFATKDFQLPICCSCKLKKQT